jgi:hypothetical protein
MAKKDVRPNRFYVYILFRHDTAEPFYVGKGEGRRWETHNWLPKADKNRHKQAIIRLAKAAGVDLPRVKIAEELTEPDAHALERELIASIGRVAFGGPLVNQSDGGEGQSGYRHTDATKAKIGAIHKGVKRGPMPAEMRAKISRSKMGCKITPEHAEAIRKAALGRKHTPESCAKISAGLMGHTFSDEARAKMSATRTGMTPSAETRAKISAAGKEREFTPEFIADFVERSRIRMQAGHSEETKAKISQSKKGTILSDEHKAKLSVAGIGRVASDETREKLSVWQRGRVRTEDAKQQMREGWAARKERLKQQMNSNPNTNEE